MSDIMSEDDLFKTLLKKKPEEKPFVPQKQIQRAAPAAPPVELQEKVIETPQVRPQEIELLVESVRNLNASVNMIHGLVKAILPVLVLILIVGIAILVKG